MSRLLSNTDLTDIDLMRRVQIAQTNVLLDRNALISDVHALDELLKRHMGEIMSGLDDIRASNAITSKRYAVLTSAAGTKELLLKILSISAFN